MVSGLCFRFRAVAVLLVFCISSVTMLGCGDGQSSSPDESVSTGDNQPTDKTTSVKPVSPASTAISPAETTLPFPSSDADPARVCEVFLSMLKTGNSDAQKLLTKTALAVTNQAELTLKSIGEETARYEISEPRYTTNKQRIAYVDVRILEEIDGKKIESQITWLVKKKSEGWRISGILLELEPNKPKDLLSFENPLDVSQINALVGEPGPAAHEADASNLNNK